MRRSSRDLAVGSGSVFISGKFLILLPRRLHLPTKSERIESEGTIASKAESTKINDNKETRSKGERERERENQVTTQLISN